MLTTTKAWRGFKENPESKNRTKMNCSPFFSQVYFIISENMIRSVRHQESLTSLSYEAKTNLFFSNISILSFLALS